MFTFTKLGTMGRFGNQLFQVAATIGMATRHDSTYIFPTWEPAAHFARQLPQSKRALQPDFALSQIAFSYRDIRIEAAGGRDTLIDLVGYFQSEKFFGHCADTIRAQFAPRADMLESIQIAYGRQMDNEPTCAVVIRRGDYAQYPMHFPMQPRAFYMRAMETFDRDTLFVVSSDDIEWCKENITATRMLLLPLVRPDDWIRNFFVGTLCRDVITSNTSFGWWVAWLNQNPDKRVIAPQPWFGPALEYLDTVDVLPPTWETCDGTAAAVGVDAGY